MKGSYHALACVVSELSDLERTARLVRDPAAQQVLTHRYCAYFRLDLPALTLPREIAVWLALRKLNGGGA